MGLERLQARTLALSVEAKNRNTKDMWRIRRDQPVVPRLAKTTLGFALRSERIRHRVLAHASAAIGGTAVLGCGAEQLVVTDGEKVRKLLFNTITSEIGQVEEGAERLRSETGLCADYLGEYWLPTSFEPTRLANPNKFAIVAHQEHLVGVNFYKSALDVVADEQRKDFAQRIVALHSATGLYPDIIGRANIAKHNDSGALQVVDTIPVTPFVQSSISQGQSDNNGVLIGEVVASWL